MNAPCIPGTDFPMTVYERRGPPPIHSEREAKQRRGLLAKIHIAKQQMGLNPGEYEMVLRSFKVSTAADLTIAELENMVTLLRHYGWKPVKSRRHADTDNTEQVEALRRRVAELAAEIRDGAKRLPGLTKKICGVVPLPWCRNAEKLRRLLACLQKIKEMES